MGCAPSKKEIPDENTDAPVDFPKDTASLIESASPIKNIYQVDECQVEDVDESSNNLQDGADSHSVSENFQRSSNGSTCSTKSMKSSLNGRSTKTQVSPSNLPLQYASQTNINDITDKVANIEESKFQDETQPKLVNVSENNEGDDKSTNNSPDVLTENIAVDDNLKVDAELQQNRNVITSNISTLLSSDIVNQTTKIDEINRTESDGSESRLEQTNDLVHAIADNGETGKVGIDTNDSKSENDNQDEIIGDNETTDKKDIEKNDSLLEKNDHDEINGDNETSNNADNDSQLKEAVNDEDVKVNGDCETTDKSDSGKSDSPLKQADNNDEFNGNSETIDKSDIDKNRKTDIVTIDYQMKKDSHDSGIVDCETIDKSDFQSKQADNVDVINDSGSADKADIDESFEDATGDSPSVHSKKSVASNATIIIDSGGFKHEEVVEAEEQITEEDKSPSHAVNINQEPDSNDNLDKTENIEISEINNVNIHDSRTPSSDMKSEVSDQIKQLKDESIINKLDSDEVIDTNTSNSIEKTERRVNFDDEIPEQSSSSPKEVTNTSEDHPKGTEAKVDIVDGEDLTENSSTFKEEIPVSSNENGDTNQNEDSSSVPHLENPSTANQIEAPNENAEHKPRKATMSKTSLASITSDYSISAYIGEILSDSDLDDDNLTTSAAGQLAFPKRSSTAKYRLTHAVDRVTQEMGEKRSDSVDKKEVENLVTPNSSDSLRLENENISDNIPQDVENSDSNDIAMEKITKEDKNVSSERSSTKDDINEKSQSVQEETSEHALTFSESKNSNNEIMEQSKLTSSDDDTNDCKSELKNDSISNGEPNMEAAFYENIKNSSETFDSEMAEDSADNISDDSYINISNQTIIEQYTDEEIEADKIADIPKESAEKASQYDSNVQEENSEKLKEGIQNQVTDKELIKLNKIVEIDSNRSVEEKSTFSKNINSNKIKKTSSLESLKLQGSVEKVELKNLNEEDAKSLKIEINRLMTNQIARTDTPLPDLSSISRNSSSLAIRSATEVIHETLESVS